jgi:transcription elongation factor GreA
MSEKFTLTEEGLKNLQDELYQLKNVDRVKNITALQEARAQGDLSENADYDAARDEQAKIEARIKEIDNILKNYKLIKTDTTDAVTIGKKVNVLFVNSNKEKEIYIVGSLEVDPFNNKFSNESPLGKALLGKREEDEFTFTSETGKEISIKVLKVENN